MKTNSCGGDVWWCSKTICRASGKRPSLKKVFSLVCFPVSEKIFMWTLRVEGVRGRRGWTAGRLNGLQVNIRREVQLSNNEFQG
jgi:hypothetical protein